MVLFGKRQTVWRAARHGAVAGLLAALSAAPIACSNDVTVLNHNPKGTVGGLIVDATSGAPLEGVQVRVVSASGAFESTTGTPDGTFRVDGVPAGHFTVTMKKDGYLPVLLEGNLVGSAGNFPIDDPIATLQPIGLVATGPDFVVRVVDANGVPVVGAKAVARSVFSYVDLSDGFTRFAGSVTVAADSAADGRLVFKGLPDIARFGVPIGALASDPSFGSVGGDTVVVSVAPINVMGQDNYQFAGGIYKFSLLQPNTPLAQIVLAGPNDPLKIVESNLEWLREGFVPPSVMAPGTVRGSILGGGDPITIAFSDAVDPTTVRAQLTLENGTPGPAVTATVNLNLVSLQAMGQLDSAKRYNLLFFAQAALNAALPSRQRSMAAPFFIRPADNTKPTVIFAKLAASSVQFLLSEPIGLGNGLPQSFDCTVFYEGANFDGSVAGQVNVVGEWSVDPTALSCGTATPVTSPVPNAAPLLNGTLAGIENKDNGTAVPTTGYSQFFTATFAPFTTGMAPATNMPGVALPAIGSKGHLYFARLPVTVRRADGTPVTSVDFTLQAP